jgi:hypothetical protein
MRHARVIRVSRLGIRLISIRRLVVLSRSIAKRRTGLPLPAFLLDRDFGVDSPKVAFTLLITLHESVVLTKVVAHTRLPTARSSLELVPRILPLNVSIDGLEVHLASG